MNRITVLILSMATSLSACTSPQGEFPSLERRPFERVAVDQPSDIMPIPPATKLPLVISQKLASLQSRHKAAAQSYLSLLPGARNAANAAAGSGAGAERWVAAHVTLSRLDKSRADSIAALAELDILIATQEDLESRDRLPSLLGLLSPAQSRMAGDVEAQNAQIRQLSLIIGL